jgi:hypothetical protein
MKYLRECLNWLSNAWGLHWLSSAWGHHLRRVIAVDWVALVWALDRVGITRSLLQESMHAVVATQIYRRVAIAAPAKHSHNVFAIISKTVAPPAGFKQ